MLDLQGLGKLRLLNLCDVAAKRLALPEGCRICVRTRRDDPTTKYDLDWAFVLPVLQSLQIRVWPGSLGPPLKELQACACLAHVWLKTSNLGTRSLPWRLDGALARLRSLTLIASGLVVAVPKDASWHFVRLHANVELSVEFQDVLAFAEAANVFSFECPTRASKLTVLLAMGEALTALGKGWATSTLPRSHGTMTAVHSLKDWCPEKGVHRGQDECMCGACMRCLHRAGVVSTLPEPQQPAGGGTPAVAHPPVLAPQDVPHDEDIDPDMDGDDDYEDEDEYGDGDGW